MMSYFKNHLFGIKAFFKSSLVVTFAVPKEELVGLIPECLELDVFEDKWAFIAMAMVQTENLRFKGLPKFMGNNFTLIGYRVFVRYTNKKGKKLRGLYILNSETNNSKITFFGNIFTHYNYRTTDFNITKKDGLTEMFSEKSNFKIVTKENNEDVVLPELSPFKNWKDARRFAGPLPFTFTYNDITKEVLIIEGVRQNWKPKPVKIENYDISFLNDLNLKKSVLANAFKIENIPYSWKKGKVEVWK